MQVFRDKDGYTERDRLNDVAFCANRFLASGDIKDRDFLKTACTRLQETRDERRKENWKQRRVA